jgi:hypothetical protein
MEFTDVMEDPRGHLFVRRDRRRRRRGRDAADSNRTCAVELVDNDQHDDTPVDHAEIARLHGRVLEAAAFG